MEAIDYYMSLNSVWPEHVPLMDTRVKEAYVLQSKKLVFDTIKKFLLQANVSQLDALVGVVVAPNEDSGIRDGGRRSRGHLDTYYASEEVDNFLASCAYTLLTEQPCSHGDVTRAIHYYQLAGRTVEVLEETCKQVAVVLPQAKSSSQSYWIQWATEYYRKYIDGGHGLVVQTLQAEGQSEIAKTLQALLHVSMVYQLAEQGQVEEGCEACQALGWFPLSSANVPAKNAILDTLSAPLQSILEHVMVLMMELLCKCHALVKVQVTAANAGVTRHSPTPLSQHMGVTSDREAALTAIAMRGKALLQMAEKRANGMSFPRRVGGSSTGVLSKETFGQLARLELTMC